MTSLDPLPGDLVWVETRTATRSVVEFEAPAPSSGPRVWGWLLLVSALLTGIGLMASNDPKTTQSTRYAKLAPLAFAVVGVGLLVRTRAGGPASGRIEADATRLRVIPSGVMRFLPREILVAEIEGFRSGDESGPAYGYSNGIGVGGVYAGVEGAGRDRWSQALAVTPRGQVVIAAFAEKRNARLMVDQLTTLLERVRALGARRS